MTPAADTLLILKKGSTGAGSGARAGAGVGDIDLLGVGLPASDTLLTGLSESYNASVLDMFTVNLKFLLYY